MLSPGDRVGVAVSGGADSVVLLHLLRALSERFRIELLVLHLNHQLRHAESDADEDWVRALAGSLALPHLIKRGGIADSGNLEEAARLSRRVFYARAMRERSMSRVALGHTRSDQAETVLFRFLRGSGSTGLAAMRPVTSEGLIRPLLTTTRGEVREWAVQHGIVWREDSSNGNLAFTRNRLRHQLMPELARDFNPRLESRLARSAVIAQDEEDYWREAIEPVFQQIARNTRFGLLVDTACLAGLHIAMQRRIIRRALCEVRGNLRGIDAQHIDAILQICRSSHGHDRVIVPGADALRSFDKLRLTTPQGLQSEKRGYSLPLTLGHLCNLPFEAGAICVERVRHSALFCATFREGQEFRGEVAELDEQALADGGAQAVLSVRNWEPGDSLELPEHTGPEKVKSLFQEHKVLLWERRHWPVVVKGREIVWVRRFGTAAKFSARPGSPLVLRLIFQSNMAESGSA